MKSQIEKYNRISIQQKWQTGGGRSGKLGEDRNWKLAARPVSENKLWLATWQAETSRNPISTLPTMLRLNCQCKKGGKKNSPPIGVVYSQLTSKSKWGGEPDYIHYICHIPHLLHSLALLKRECYSARSGPRLVCFLVRIQHVQKIWLRLIWHRF